MAGEQYFKVAAANIQNAVIDIRKEIDNAKAQITQLEQNFHRHKDDLSKESRLKAVSAGVPDLTDNMRSKLLQEAAQDHRRISDVETEFKRQRDDLMKYIDNLQRDIHGLESLVSDLNRRASG